LKALDGGVEISPFKVKAADFDGFFGAERIVNRLFGGTGRRRFEAGRGRWLLLRGLLSESRK